MLKKQRAASATEIGRGLNMSAASVRHHLSILLADGRITLAAQGRKAGRGRPVKLYGLSERFLGDNLALLSDSILNEWMRGLSTARREAALHRLADSLMAKFGPSEPGLPATRRLALVIEKLNALHYQARWEAGAAGPRVLLGHCPYAAIIQDHPELCRLDAELLSGVLQARLRQTAKINVQGAAACGFEPNK